MLEGLHTYIEILLNHSKLKIIQCVGQRRPQKILASELDLGRVSSFIMTKKLCFKIMSKQYKLVMRDLWIIMSHSQKLNVELSFVEWNVETVCSSHRSTSFNKLSKAFNKIEWTLKQMLRPFARAFR